MASLVGLAQWRLRPEPCLVAGRQVRHEFVVGGPHPCTFEERVDAIWRQTAVIRRMGPPMTGCLLRRDCTKVIPRARPIRGRLQSVDAKPDAIASEGRLEQSTSTCLCLLAKTLRRVVNRKGPVQQTRIIALCRLGNAECDMLVSPILEHMDAVHVQEELERQRVPEQIAPPLRENGVGLIHVSQEALHVRAQPKRHVCDLPLAARARQRSQ